MDVNTHTAGALSAWEISVSHQQIHSEQDACDDSSGQHRGGANGAASDDW